MSGAAVIDTAVGLAFLFFLVALGCSAVVESVANLLKKRSKYLLRGLRDLLDTPLPTGEGAAPNASGGDQGLTAAAKGERAMYDSALLASGRPRPDMTEPPPPTKPPPWTIALMGHALVRPFKQSGPTGGPTRNPSYLPAKTFATALVDLLVPDSTGETTIDNIRDAVVSLDDSVPFKQALLSLLKTASDTTQAFMSSVEQWYDDSMDRISGSYKRWAKRWIIVFALAVAVGLQVDTIQVASSLYTDGPLRQAVVAAATNDTLCPQGQTPAETRACVTTELSALQSSAGLPVGWSAPLPDNVGSWALKALGWGLTALAASLGAPFWFQALTKLGSLRNTGAKPQRTDEPPT